MNLPIAEQTLQIIVWFLALVEFILAVYILLLNVWHTANRHVSALLLLFAANNLALGGMIGAVNAEGADLIARAMAATTPALNPGIFLTAIVMLKPEWLRGRWRWAWRLLYVLVFLPVTLTLLDGLLGTGLWYTGLPASYAGGFISLSEFAAGPLSTPLRVVDIYAISMLTLLPLLYIGFLDRQAAPLIRRLSRLLLGAQLAAIVMQFGLRGMLGQMWPDINTSMITTPVTVLLFALVYAYAAFQQMISERRLQRGSLQARLTLLLVGITLPLLVAAISFIVDRAAVISDQEADTRLSTGNRALGDNVRLWLDAQTSGLQYLVSLPDIVSMDAAQQEPALVAMAAAYPHMYLVSTTDLSGINVARNDGEAPKDYSDREWFLGARGGAAITLETLLGRTSGQPALVMSMPIRDAAGTIVGVGMFASNLSDIDQQVQISQVGETGLAFVVDAQNLVVAHKDPAYAAELRDLSTYPPVSAMRQGTRGRFSFVDDEGRRWRASVDTLDNGWGVVVQQQESELLSSRQLFQRLAWIALGTGAAMLALVTWLAVRQAFQPIGALTRTVTAIAGGDLNRVAPVEGEDEFGVLAQAFNSMTGQLRELIGGLEASVASRTADLARRSAQLEAAANVARDSAAIRNVGQLLETTVHLISERFGFYHAGIFLLDEAREYAVLRAASSEGGQRMLDRGHRLKVGAVGLVGHVAAAGEARTALDVGADAVYFSNPDLPDTHSEVALPLKARGRVIGVLDVQSTQGLAFSDEDVAVLQLLADQVSLAIENARLLAEGEERLHELNALLGRYGEAGWQSLAADRPGWGYVYDGTEVSPRAIAHTPETEPQITLPLRVRDAVIGHLDLVLPERPPSPDEAALAQMVVDQAGIALENARLFREARQRLGELEVLQRVSMQMATSLDLSAVLDSIVESALAVVKASYCHIRLFDAASGTFGFSAALWSDGKRDLLAATARTGGMSEALIRSSQPIVIDDAVRHPLFASSEAQGWGVQAIAGFPIRRAGQVLGIFMVAFFEPHVFSEDELRVLGLLVDQAAVAIENARLFEDARARAEQERLVTEIANRVRASTDVDVILRTAIGELGRALRAADGLIYLRSDAGNGGVPAGQPVDREE